MIPTNPTTNQHETMNKKNIFNPALQEMHDLATWHDTTYAKTYTAQDAVENPMLSILADLTLEASVIDFKPLADSTNPIEDLAWYQHEIDTAAKLEVTMIILGMAQIKYTHKDCHAPDKEGHLTGEEVVEYLQCEIITHSANPLGGDIAGIVRAAKLKARIKLMDKITRRMKQAQARMQLGKPKPEEFTAEIPDKSIRPDRWSIKNSKGEGFHYTTVKNEEGKNVNVLTFSNRAKPLSWVHLGSAKRWITKAMELDKTAAITPVFFKGGKFTL